MHVVCVGRLVCGDSDLVMLQRVESLPAALDHRRQVLVGQDEMSGDTGPPL